MTKNKYLFFILLAISLLTAFCSATKPLSVRIHPGKAVTEYDISDLFCDYRLVPIQFPEREWFNHHGWQKIEKVNGLYYIQWSGRSSRVTIYDETGKYLRDIRSGEYHPKNGYLGGSISDFDVRKSDTTLWTVDDRQTIRKYLSGSLSPIHTFRAPVPMGQIKVTNRHLLGFNFKSSTVWAVDPESQQIVDSLYDPQLRYCRFEEIDGKYFLVAQNGNFAAVFDPVNQRFSSQQILLHSRTVPAAVAEKVHLNPDLALCSNKEYAYYSLDYIRDCGDKIVTRYKKRGGRYLNTLDKKSGRSIEYSVYPGSPFPGKELLGSRFDVFTYNILYTHSDEGTLISGFRCPDSSMTKYLKQCTVDFPGTHDAREIADTLSQDNADFIIIEMMLK